MTSLTFLLIWMAASSESLRSITMDIPMVIQKIRGEAERVKLPSPVLDSGTSIEKALLKRRSVREYGHEPLTLPEISQLLWAAQGVTERKEGLRAAPSAGALYPLEVYLVAGDVDGIEQGVYKYKPHGHELVKVVEGDKRMDIYRASLYQEPVKDAPALIVISAIYQRTTIKYGERGIRYVHMEVGHAAENVYLQAVALNLGTVVVGAFHDEDVRKALNMPKDETPLYVMPVGRLR